VRRLPATRPRLSPRPPPSLRWNQPSPSTLSLGSGVVKSFYHTDRRARRPGIDSRITTATLSDALDAAGRRDQVLSAAIRPLAKGMRASGRAATVGFGPVGHDTDRPYDDIIAFIDGLQAGSVVAAGTAASERSRFWGELFTAAAIGPGAAWLVCDGYIRD